jgi:DNA polymerase-3 subunit gamma/tau
MDVIEIDAASNRGINEMRELRESVRFRPARDRYKVFIVDEAHQITSEAFNALLKTLEEPPEWVVFLLCTTESHKIPSTIVSRCQHFSFRSVDFAELVKRMEWIMQQEGITADPDAVAVLARAGEGSVRDSLSALDQAIACCGNKLDAAEVRALLGMFSLESLGRVTQALANNDSQKMFDVVAELEANGRSLQHFARELARHFRNLLVVKIAGGETRLVAASQAEHQKLAEAAAPFSEDDLTRYLQLSLDLFRDLQSSLQPRLHLEMGLLRMVQAGRLVPIEEALASLTSGVGGAAAPPKPAPPVANPAKFAPPPTNPAKPAPAAVPASGDLRARIHAALLEAKLIYVADALERSELTESPNELIFTTPKEYQLNLKQPEFEAAAKRMAGRPVRVTIKIGDAAPATPVAAAPKREDEATARALSHPVVKRFQDVFEDAQVRTVRNLKDT